MSFVLATSIFGFVFIVRRPEFQIPASRYFAVIIALFALFCYTQDWNDWEEDTPSIRSLLYDRGGLLFDEHASITNYDAPLDEWSDELPEFE